MATDPKSAAPQTATALPTKGQGVKIFTYPKIIFIFPTMIVALVCGIGMSILRDEVKDPTRRELPGLAQAAERAVAAENASPTTPEGRKSRFTSPQNVLAMIFMFVFAINMIIMAIDFPRFTLLGIILSVGMISFLFLWLNAYYDLIPPLVGMLEGIYAWANAQFYILFASIVLLTLALVWATRWLDYWEILPNEILHHHGPLSDLERFPTFNLKFDKEIPDVLEFLILGAGRLVLRVQSEQRSIVLDNVLFINSKEAALKNLMSRMEVRVASDKELAET
jgi:hypothetical protein